MARTDKELPVLMRFFPKSLIHHEQRPINHTSTTHPHRTPSSHPIPTLCSLWLWIREKVTPTPATWLDVILYSRQQIEKENAAMHNKPSTTTTTTHQHDTPPLSAHLSTASTSSEWQWGIVSIKPQNECVEIGMLPITMMRNALGVEEGGSGVPLDRTKYLQSVDFWSKHANVQ